MRVIEERIGARWARKTKSSETRRRSREGAAGGIFSACPNLFWKNTDENSDIN